MESPHKRLASDRPEFKSPEPKSKRRKLTDSPRSGSPASRPYTTDHRVGLVWYSFNQIGIMDSLPQHKHKALQVQLLLEEFKLHDNMSLIYPQICSEHDLVTYHSEQYIRALKKASKLETDGEASQSSCDEDESDELATEFGLDGDCAPFPRLWDHVRLTAGASILAAKFLIDVEKKHRAALSTPPSPLSLPQSSSSSDSESTTPTPKESPISIAINWMGGRHHAKEDSASGFCFVNDVVLAIVQLQTYFSKIMYIDIDIHQYGRLDCTVLTSSGDGVEEAFAFSNDVMTISFHQYEPGFFPGSGDIDSVGCGSGKYHSVNVPLQPGISSEQYVHIFKTVVETAKSKFNPDAVVLVCGADFLMGDPLGSFNVTLDGAEACFKIVQNLGLPLLLLGGGGYHMPNVARLAACITALAGNTELPDSIPSTLNYVDSRVHYVPSVAAKPNQNDEQSIHQLLTAVLCNLNKIESGPPSM